MKYGACIIWHFFVGIMTIQCATPPHSFWHNERISVALIPRRCITKNSTIVDCHDCPPGGILVHDFYTFTPPGQIGCVCRDSSRELDRALLHRYEPNGLNLETVSFRSCTVLREWGTLCMLNNTLQEFMNSTRRTWNSVAKQQTSTTWGNLQVQWKRCFGIHFGTFRVYPVIRTLCLEDSHFLFIQIMDL